MDYPLWVPVRPGCNELNDSNQPAEVIIFQVMSDAETHGATAVVSSPNKLEEGTGVRNRAAARNEDGIAPDRVPWHAAQASARQITQRTSDTSALRVDQLHRDLL
ncbi:hypothetical protein GCM10022200_25360 [Microbacterium awajiense]|uniref:Uncharacterized protein n=1 Tax=Microbacterium awajiense TaxID=415214 RepID=A0ABP7AU88_9MICO